MSRIVEYNNGRRHPYIAQMRRGNRERERLKKKEEEIRRREAALKEREDQLKIKNHGKKLSTKIVLTIAGISLALAQLNRHLTIAMENPTCPVPPKYYPVAKPRAAANYPPVVHPTCGTTPTDKLEELEKAITDVDRLHDFLEKAEKDMKKDVSTTKRKTFVDKVKAAVKDKS